MSEKEKLNKKKERFISLYNDDKKDDLYSLLLYFYILVIINK